MGGGGGISDALLDPPVGELHKLVNEHHCFSQLGTSWKRLKLSCTPLVDEILKDFSYFYCFPYPLFLPLCIYLYDWLLVDLWRGGGGVWGMHVPLFNFFFIFMQFSTKLCQTWMHSSRMRTNRSGSHLLGEVLASVHAGIPILPRVWAWRPPRPDPSTSPLGVGLETCNACWDTPLPRGQKDRYV